MSDVPISEILAPMCSMPKKNLIWDAFSSPDSDGEAPTSQKNSGSSSDSPTQEEGSDDEKLFQNSLLSVNAYCSRTLQIASEHA